MIWIAGLSVLAIVGACVAIVTAISAVQTAVDFRDAFNAHSERYSDDIAELRRELSWVLDKEANHADYDC